MKKTKHGNEIIRGSGGGRDVRPGEDDEIRCTHLPSFFPEFDDVKTRKRDITRGVLYYGRKNNTKLWFTGYDMSKCYIVGNLSKEEGKLIGRQLDKFVQVFEISDGIYFRGFKGVLKERKSEMKVDIKKNFPNTFLRKAIRCENLVSLTLPTITWKKLSKNKLMMSSQMLPNLTYFALSLQEIDIMSAYVQLTETFTGSEHNCNIFKLLNLKKLTGVRLNICFTDLTKIEVKYLMHELKVSGSKLTLFLSYFWRIGIWNRKFLSLS